MPTAEQNPTQSYAMPVVAALTCFAAWVLGGVLTRPNLDWYATLAKPGFTPANEVFPVVWTILYAMMAMSAWLLWRAPGKEEDRRPAFTWFFWQLAIGVIWSYAFFFLHSPGLGLVVILALLVAITITIVLFDRLSRPAALLLLPLLLWVAFAAGLNFAIWFLNR
ncbi:MAG TPA: TspO/MBR family protein [Methyloceanibacter sp.]|nr:TspO/MBR family protein [Methyloceanibacter sp.]